MTIPDSYGGKTANISPFVSRSILKINLEHQNDGKYPKDNISYLQLQPLNFSAQVIFFQKAMGKKRPASPPSSLTQSWWSRKSKWQTFPKEKSLPIKNRSQSKIATPLTLWDQRWRSQHAVWKMASISPFFGHPRWQSILNIKVTENFSRRNRSQSKLHPLKNFETKHNYPKKLWASTFPLFITRCWRSILNFEMTEHFSREMFPIKNCNR